MSVLARVAYDGTDFHGFARQPGLQTVQGSLERSLQQVYGAQILIRGASRTDAGVHARGQLVAFEVPRSPHIPVSGLRQAMAGTLPPGLMVMRMWRHPNGERARPRFENGGKLYRYSMSTAPVRDPLRERFEWHVHRRLDVEAMRRATQPLIGEQDFQTFRAGDCQAKTSVRRIRRIDVSCPSPSRVVIEVDGEAFLKNMVRIIVGTLVDVGTGRIAPQDMQAIRDARERKRAGQTAPPQGLCLEEVFWNEPEPEP